MRVVTAAAILAGGRGERIGGAKAMRALMGKPLVAHVAAVLRPSVSHLAVAGDRQAATIVDAVFLRDDWGDAVGPLAGVMSALDWAASEGAEWLAIAPCDTPLLPAGISECLIDVAARADAPLAFVETPAGKHPLVSVWRVELRGALRGLLSDGHPSVRDAMARLDAIAAPFEDETAFFNVNSPDDLAEAEQLLLARGRTL